MGRGGSDLLQRTRAAGRFPGTRQRQEAAERDAAVREANRIDQMTSESLRAQGLVPRARTSAPVRLARLLEPLSQTGADWSSVTGLVADRAAAVTAFMATHASNPLFDDLSDSELLASVVLLLRGRGQDVERVWLAADGPGEAALGTLARSWGLSGSVLRRIPEQ